MTFYIEHLNTPTGRMLIATDQDDRVRGIEWESHEVRLQRLLRRQYGEVTLQPRDPQRESPARRALGAYFEGDLDAVNKIETLTNGTEFQRRVWAALCLVPAGHTISYGALAARLGCPAAARAVGLANGANPIPVVVPCHRVIGADGSLIGFGGGLERKRWLLRHEACAIGPAPIGTSYSLGI